ncbi:MAG: DUF6174 domain-containing protein [Chloroflexi bacterium]|nr:DUF6174 domain-containing protein [Chloroflexota bacterium]
MIKQMSIAVACAAALVSMAACGTADPTPAPTPFPPAATPTVAASPPAATPAPTATPPTATSAPTAIAPAATPTASALDSAQAALLQARERWENSGIADYTYTGAWTCFCPEDYRADTQVTVGGGNVVAVSAVAPNAGPIPAPERFVPIEGLFALIQDAITQGAARIEVSYDETFGYPAEVFIDYDKRMADEEDRFTISSFTPL